MYVSDLVTAVSKFAFGRKNPTQSDRENYLFLLNLADCEYYACAKNSKALRYAQDIFFNNNIDNFVDIPSNYIYSIYNDKIKLKESDEKEGFNFVENGSYYLLNNKIFLNKSNLKTKVDPDDGVVKPYITLLWQPKRKQLVETVQVQPLIPIEIDTPIYPEEYHLGLVHGAVYYLCQTHEGFITKITESKKNWEHAKQNLMSHYIKGV